MGDDREEVGKLGNILLEFLIGNRMMIK